MKGVKESVVVLVTIVFTLTVAGTSFAADIKGVISKIEGSEIIVKAADGKQKTVEGEVKGLKVGDKVVVKDGKIAKKKAIEGC